MPGAKGVGETLAARSFPGAVAPRSGDIDADHDSTVVPIIGRSARGLKH